MSLVSYLSNLGPLVPTREHDARKESMEQFHCAGHSGINLSCAHSIYCSTFIWPVVLQCGMFFGFFFFCKTFLGSCRPNARSCHATSASCCCQIWKCSCWISISEQTFVSITCWLVFLLSVTPGSAFSNLKQWLISNTAVYYGLIWSSDTSSLCNQLYFIRAGKQTPLFHGSKAHSPVREDSRAVAQ